MDYLDTKGRIFDVQKYSVHDGPGIRTIVFLKGCVLRCRWCCNPESQEYRIQNMKVLGEDKVIGRDVTVREMIEEVEKDRAYYYRSGGGITLSGGECMCQADFSRDLLRAAKERGINTAVESMACAPWEKIEQRLRGAAAGDFCIVLYNPSSKKRTDHLRRACDILLEIVPPETVCGLVRSIGREGESCTLTTLGELRNTQVDMLTTVFVGNSRTRVMDGRMVTPRGYRGV